MALNFKIAAPASASTRREPSAVRTLLLVDDDKTLLLTLRMFFQRNGWHLLEADSVEEALKLWEANQKHIDGIVTDYSFDGTLTGLDLVTAVQGRRRGFPCVVISGLWAMDKRPRDEPDKNLFYRVKPFDPRELLQVLEQAIAGAAARPNG
jgi:DNA-binding NtrC family response regulator